MAELVLWCAALLLVHTYFLYPLVLFILEGMAQVVHNVRYMRSRHDERKEEQAGELPRVSLVVAACKTVWRWTIRRTASRC
jgi:hypothetical protein